MTTKEIKELAQIAFDTYRGILDPVPLECLPEISQQDWINTVKVIKNEIEKKYTGCLDAGEPSIIPSGFIALPMDDGRSMYVRALDITSVIAGQPDPDSTEENIHWCWMHIKDGVYRCEYTAEDVISMIAKVIGANRNG